jgi:hypothetical protein
MLFRRRAKRIADAQSASSDIEAAEYSLVSVPWKGSPCMVKVRELSDIQIASLGGFSLIETDEFKWSRAPQKKIAWSELLDYANQNVKICKAALVSPTYDKIFAIVGRGEFFIDVKRQVEGINVQLEEMPEGPARQELEAIRDSLIMAWDIILPDDFMTGVIAHTLGIHKTDIKKVTEEMLLNAAVLAERGHKAPHEYIHGAFTDFNLRDIDTQAWILYERHMEELREEAQRRKGA